MRELELQRSEKSEDLNSEIDPIAASHRMLARFNQTRLNPALPSKDWRKDLTRSVSMLELEREILDWEKNQISKWTENIPAEPQAFMSWFENLKETGPGQNHPLFDWLAESAPMEKMRWFIQQEVAGEAGFEDLVALSQVKIPTRPKLEMARNYWDEMGKGNEPAMHGPMLGRVAEEIGVDAPTPENAVAESLALSNIMMAFAMNRDYAYHSIGALGVIELTAPGRARKVHQGLKRLGMTSEGQRYYLLHSAIDIKHSLDWNREVIAPLVDGQPQIARAIAEGALMRLHAGARCFERYENELMIDS